MQMTRCDWVTDDPLYIDYHDHEWGRPVYDDQLLFEFLVLEGMQAGLSWITILKKRDRFREVFEQFSPEKIARFDERKKAELMAEPGIIRNRLKINAAIVNAQCYLDLVESGESFSSYIWQFVNGAPIQNHWPTHDAVPASTPVSEAMSKHLKKHG